MSCNIFSLSRYQLKSWDFSKYCCRLFSGYFKVVWTVFLSLRPPQRHQFIFVHFLEDQLCNLYNLFFSNCKVGDLNKCGSFLKSVETENSINKEIIPIQNRKNTKYKFCSGILYGVCFYCTAPLMVLSDSSYDLAKPVSAADFLFLQVKTFFFDNLLSFKIF